MQTVLTLVALTTAPGREATLGMEDVAKVHVVTFITIFECIFFNSYVSFGAFQCRNNRLMRKKID